MATQYGLFGDYGKDVERRVRNWARANLADHIDLNVEGGYNTTLASEYCAKDLDLYLDADYSIAEEVYEWVDAEAEARGYPGGGTHGN